jgi:hypothetical protein
VGAIAQDVYSTPVYASEGGGLEELDALLWGDASLDLDAYADASWEFTSVHVGMLKTRAKRATEVSGHLFSVQPGCELP